MGLLSWFRWRRVGSDPYYASLDKAMQRIQADLDAAKARGAQRRQLWARVQARFWAGFAAVYAVVLGYAAWVLRQPPGRFTAGQHSARVAPVLLVPVAGYLLHCVLGWLLGLLGRRDVKRARALEGRLRKMVAELKDSTHYERTLALLKKYDPDFVPPTPRAAAGAVGAGLPPAPGTGARRPAAGAAGGGAGGAGRAGAAAASAAGTLLPVLGQLWSHAADKFIADDPVMLRLMREAQREGDALRAENARLAAENAALRQQLGLPPAAEPGDGGAALEETTAARAAATGLAAAVGDEAAGVDSGAPGQAGEQQRRQQRQEGPGEQGPPVPGEQREDEGDEGRAEGLKAPSSAGGSPTAAEAQAQAGGGSGGGSIGGGSSGEDWEQVPQPVGEGEVFPGADGAGAIGAGGGGLRSRSGAKRAGKQ